MGLFDDDERMLSKLIKALMAYYGPVRIIQQVVIETDVVLNDMAVQGSVKEAKELAATLDMVRLTLT